MKILPPSTELEFLKYDSQIVQSNYFLNNNLQEPTYYGHFEGSNLGLGQGFNPINLLDIKRPCIIFNEPEFGTGGRGNVELIYVDTYAALTEILRKDIKLSASYAGISGKYSQSRETDYRFNTNSVRVVLRAEADYGEFRLGVDANITEEAKELIKSDPVEFAERFGTRYIFSEHRVQGLYIVFTMYNVTYETKSLFRQSISASGGFGRLSAKAESKFEKVASETFRSNRLSFTVETIGKSSLGDFSSVVRTALENSQNPISSISASVSNVLKTFKHSNGSPRKYFVASMETFGLEIDSSIRWTRERNQKLIDYKQAIENLQYKLPIMTDIVNLNHPFVKVAPEGQKLLLNHVHEVESKLNELMDAHSRLLSIPDERSIPMVDVSVFGMSDQSIRRFSVLPYMYTQGIYYLNSPDGFKQWQTMSFDLVSSLLTIPAEDRKLAIKELIPDVGEAYFQANFLPAYLSVIKTYSTISILKNGTWIEEHNRLMMTTGWRTFNLSAFEKSAIDYAKSLPTHSNNRVDIQRRFFFELTDRANRTTFHDLLKCEWYQINKTVNDLKVTFNVSDQLR